MFTISETRSRAEQPPAGRAEPGPRTAECHPRRGGFCEGRGGESLGENVASPEPAATLASPLPLAAICLAQPRSGSAGTSLRISLSWANTASPALQIPLCSFLPSPPSWAMLIRWGTQGNIEVIQPIRPWIVCIQQHFVFLQMCEMQNVPCSKNDSSHVLAACQQILRTADGWYWCIHMFGRVWTFLCLRFSGERSRSWGSWWQMGRGTRDWLIPNLHSLLHVATGERWSQLSNGRLSWSPAHNSCTGPACLVLNY